MLRRVDHIAPLPSMQIMEMQDFYKVQGTSL